MAGKCSKHRKCSEFKSGDRVKIVCSGGRNFGSCAHFGQIGQITHSSETAEPYYGVENQTRWGGLVCVKFEGCYGHYFSPRALEKIG